MNCINQVVTDQYAIYNGDCVEVIAGLPDKSVDYSIFSPPFSSLYTYSNSPRDMGNARNDGEFFEQFQYLIKQLARVMKPARNVSFHCMQLPTSKERDGYIGLKDFRGDLIRAFQAEGFIYASEVTIWKDPVTAMQRTKALGLLHKTVRGNGSFSRQGIPDFLVTMRAPGDIADDNRVRHYRDEAELVIEADKLGVDRADIECNHLPVQEWQQLASPVWMDINPSDTLQYKSAREHDDERHICPLQLEVIRRGIKLWTNPGDVVLTPFLGIGSEVYTAVEMGRRGIGAELKESYFQQAAKNIASLSQQSDMFSA
jgi:DNA modification methylase